MTEVQQHLLEQRTRLSAFNGVTPRPAFFILADFPVCWPESAVKHYTLAVECL